MCVCLTLVLEWRRDGQRVCVRADEVDIPSAEHLWSEPSRGSSLSALRQNNGRGSSRNSRERERERESVFCPALIKSWDQTVCVFQLQVAPQNRCVCVSKASSKRMCVICPRTVIVPVDVSWSHQVIAPEWKNEWRQSEDRDESVPIQAPLPELWGSKIKNKTSFYEKFSQQDRVNNSLKCCWRVWKQGVYERRFEFELSCSCFIFFINLLFNLIILLWFPIVKKKKNDVLIKINSKEKKINY